MASTSETGHSKNASTFEDLISRCVTFGPSYNPSKTPLKIAGLNTQLAAVQAALQAVNVAKITHDNATNAREVAFKPLKSLATKIVGSLSATDALEQTIDDARSINNKIQGKRAAAIKKPDEKEIAEGEKTPRTASTSQQSYDKMIDHYTKLITLLSMEPKYLPNENELKVATLNTMLTDLKTKNTAAVNGANNITSARITRDKLLYAENTGVLDTATAIKQYVKSLYGVNSTQYRKITELKFSKGPAL